MPKKSIRFYNDHQVRAVWDESRSKWWFSAIDIVRAINNEENYVKAGNFWRWHINFCPGWKGNFSHQDEETKAALREKYNFQKYQ